MEEEKQEKKIETSEKIAVIRISGKVKLNQKIIDTLAMLNLHKKNNCVVIPSTEINIGMIKRVKDFVTWGKIDNETLKLLKEERGKEDKKTFSLHPPRKGYGRKGTKIPFKLGGALGDRKDKINDMIKRMI